MDDRSLAFDKDVSETGAYRYSSGQIESARLANLRYTELILASADFSGKTVIDVGCGDGTFTAALAEQCGARKVLGIEPSPKASERASALYKNSAGLSFRCAVSRDLMHEGQKYDIAVYRGVIHHVADPSEEIRTALLLARKIIILEPNGLNPLMKLVEKISPYHREHGERSYSPSRLCSWITEAGGAVDGVRLFGLVPYFCHPWIARLGRYCEPFIEPLPGISSVLCGQYVVTATSPD